MNNVNEFKTNFYYQCAFPQMTDDKKVSELLVFLGEEDILFGEKPSYWYYNNERNIEFRTNIYYKNIALFKICVQIANNKNNSIQSNIYDGHVRIEKIRTAEQYSRRIQDIGYLFSKYETRIFMQSFSWSHIANLKKFIQEIKEDIDKYLKFEIELKTNSDLKLKGITINSFKKIQQISIDFDDNLQILVGKNNAGKSSIIQGLALSYDALDSLFVNKKLKFNEYGLLQPQTCDEGVKIKHLSFVFSNFKELFNINEKGLNEGVEIATILFKNNEAIEISAKYVDDYLLMYVSNCSSLILERKLNEFLQKPIVLIPSFFSIVTEEERRSYAKYKSLLKSGKHNQLFRNILFDLKEGRDKINNTNSGTEGLDKIIKNYFKDGYTDEAKFNLSNNSIECRKIIDKLVQIIEKDSEFKVNKFGDLQIKVEKIFGIKGFDVSFSEEDDEYMEASYLASMEDIGTPKRLDISTLGMGALQFIQVLAQVYIGNPSIVLLDEPDAHLHSELQEQILQLFNELSVDFGTKFVIATHSKDIINNVDKKTIRYLADDNKLHKDLDKNQFIRLLTNLGISTEELIGVSIGKRIILVEGKTDYEYIRLLYKRFSNDDERNFDLIKFIPLNGKNNVIRNNLNCLIDDTIHEFKKAIIYDRDYRPLKEHTNEMEAFEKEGFKVIAWSKKELENYFLVPSVIVSVINERPNQKNKITKDSVISVIDNVFDKSRNIIKHEYCMETRWKKTKKQSEEVLATISVEADEYINTNSSLDILPGKEAIRCIKDELMEGKAPSDNDFIKAIIGKMTKEDLHQDVIRLLDIIKEMAQ